MDTRARVFTVVVAAIAIAEVGCGPRSDVTIVPPRVPQGGRAVAIAVSQGDAKRLVVATATGGLFRTFDGGVSFQHLDAFPTIFAVDVASPRSIPTRSSPPHATISAPPREAGSGAARMAAGRGGAPPDGRSPDATRAPAQGASPTCRSRARSTSPPIAGSPSAPTTGRPSPTRCSIRSTPSSSRSWSSTAPPVLQLTVVASGSSTTGSGRRRSVVPTPAAPSPRTPSPRRGGRRRTSLSRRTRSLALGLHHERRRLAPDADAV